MPTITSIVFTGDGDKKKLFLNRSQYTEVVITATGIVIGTDRTNATRLTIETTSRRKSWEGVLNGRLGRNADEYVVTVTNTKNDADGGTVPQAVTVTVTNPDDSSGNLPNPPQDVTIE